MKWLLETHKRQTRFF